jgi:hypothetical protein
MAYYQLSEFGIGHDWKGIDEHLNGLLMAANQGDVPSLYQEIENLRLCYFSMASKYNPEYLSWLCLVHSIDGKPFDDLSEETLAKWAVDLGGFNDSEFVWSQVFEEVKKKFPQSFESTFRDGQAQTEVYGM